MVWPLSIGDQVIINSMVYVEFYDVDSHYYQCRIEATEYKPITPTTIYLPAISAPFNVAYPKKIFEKVEMDRLLKHPYLEDEEYEIEICPFYEETGKVTYTSKKGYGSFDTFADYTIDLTECDSNVDTYIEGKEVKGDIIKILKPLKKLNNHYYGPDHVTKFKYVEHISVNVDLFGGFIHHPSEAYRMRIQSFDKKSVFWAVPQQIISLSLVEYLEKSLEKPDE